MTPPAVTADAAAVCALLDTLDPQERHVFGVAVADMTQILIRAEARVGVLEAENAALRRRVANQRGLIAQLRRAPDPSAVLADISDLLDGVPAGEVMLRPEMPGGPAVASDPVGEAVRGAASADHMWRHQALEPCTDPECGLCGRTDSGCRPAAEWKPVRGSWRDRFSLRRSR